MRSFASFQPTLASVIAAAALLGGCKDEPTGPATVIPPDLVQRNVVPGKVNVCTVGPSGDYVYTVTAQGGVTGGTLPNGGSVSIGAGQCKDVWLATSTTRRPDPSTTVVVRTSTLPSGARFNRIVSAETTNSGHFVSGESVTFTVNYYHGGAVTFYFGTP